MSDWIFLVVAVGLAATGGELFVRGAVGFAAGMRVPPGIVGATIAAFATSTPEFSVAMNAAIAGKTEIALGDALGSNIVNIAVVLGVALAFAPLRPDRPDIRRDLPVAFAAPILTVVLVSDGVFGRVDALVALLFFATWLAVAALQARRARIATAEVLGERRLRLAGIEMALGLGFLVVAGRLIVVAATGIGESLGFDKFIVGVTLVAFATSTPELATTLIARLRGHSEIALGTLVGSNIFNNLWIVGGAALVSPIEVDRGDVAVAAGVGVAALLLAIPIRGVLGQDRAIVLLAGYGLYVAALVWSR